MKNRRVWIWVTIAVVIIGIAIAVRYANTGGVNKNVTQAPQVGVAQQGQKAPEFQTATNQGYFDLAKADRPVFLEVFATWCPHCQRETAVIDKLYNKYKNRVDFVAVSGHQTGMDGQTPSSELDVLNFAKKFHAQYPVAYDGSLDVAKKYLQGGFPTLVVINRDKTVSYITSGETPYSELNSAIQRVL
jgi:cytochrome c biogenesis protein CcmG, thiol:disulfide interchange protein DsbE